MKEQQEKDKKRNARIMNQNSKSQTDDFQPEKSQKSKIIPKHIIRAQKELALHTDQTKKRSEIQKKLKDQKNLLFEMSSKKAPKKEILALMKEIQVSMETLKELNAVASSTLASKRELSGRGRGGRGRGRGGRGRGRNYKSYKSLDLRPTEMTWTNFDTDVSKELIAEHFGAFGTVQVEIKDRVAHVKYINRWEAEKAMKFGNLFRGQKILLEWKKTKSVKNNNDESNCNSNVVSDSNNDDSKPKDAKPKVTEIKEENENPAVIVKSDMSHAEADDDDDSIEVDYE